MTRRQAFAAGGVIATYVVAVVGGTAIQVLGGNRSTDLLEGLTYIVAFGLFAVLGAILIARRPGHAMGPLFATVGLLPAIGFPGETYAALRLLDGGTVPRWARLLAWPTTFSWYVVLAIIIVYVPLLFPDGHLPSRRWRWVGWVVGGGLAVVCGVSAVSEDIVLQTVGPGGRRLAVVNPLGIAGMPYGEDHPLFDPAGAVIVVGVVAAVTAVAVRFRRAHGVERQQVKWLLLPVCLSGVGILAALLPVAGPAWAGLIIDGVTLVGLVGLPVAIAVAILRYRLYEIDRLISRTLTYALVSAVLVTGYVALAVLPTVVLGAPDGRDAGSPDVLVAGATLAMAAAFVPVRRRVQGAVDRRFNRARYDTQVVAERFGARLRGDLDIASLAADLARVVGVTAQPTHVSLWLPEREIVP